MITINEIRYIKPSWYFYGRKILTLLLVILNTLSLSYVILYWDKWPNRPKSKIFIINLLFLIVMSTHMFYDEIIIRFFSVLTYQEMQSLLEQKKMSQEDTHPLKMTTLSLSQSEMMKCAIPPTTENKKMSQEDRIRLKYLMD